MAEWGQPWRAESFKFSADLRLETRVRDVIGLYLNPPDTAVVLCVDEKPQAQALECATPVQLRCRFLCWVDSPITVDIWLDQFRSVVSAGSPPSRPAGWLGWAGSRLCWRCGSCSGVWGIAHDGGLDGGPVLGAPPAEKVQGAQYRDA